MITRRSPGISNLTFMFIWASSITLLGGSFSTGLFIFGLLLNVIIVITYVINQKINRILDNDVKIGKYLYYDFKNEPVSYLITLGCLIITTVWIIKDTLEGRGLELDSLIGFYSIYFIISVMILIGYIRDYEKLP